MPSKKKISKSGHILSKSSRVPIVLFCIGLFYFIFFIFPNLTGTKNINMISVFSIDEFAQYPNLLHMYNPGSSIFQSFLNFLHYTHYFYGFPFYFFSALALLPSKLINGSNWVNQTSLNMVLLRQLINVLPMIVAAFLFTRMQTRSKPWWLAIGLFVFLLIIPGVFVNNMIWHPDSLAIMFVAFTFYFLELDGLKFGRYFYLAAVTCGVAIGIKYQGLFFFLAIPIYLLWGLVTNKISLKYLIKNGLIFLGLLLLTVVITNPLLLLPQERADIIQYQLMQFLQTTRGIIVASKQSFIQPGVFPDLFKESYGFFALILLASFGVIVGILQPKSSLISILTAVYIIPLFLTINNAATSRISYFIPVVMILFCNLMNYFPDKSSFANKSKVMKTISIGMGIVVGIAIVVQSVFFIGSDVRAYKAQMNRENTAPGIIFYNELDQNVLSKIPDSQSLVILRDWQMYIPPKPKFDVEIDWNNITYDSISTFNPDIIVLDQENIKFYTSSEALDRAANLSSMKEYRRFNQDAKADLVKGYKLILQNENGIALIKTQIYESIN